MCTSRQERPSLDTCVWKHRMRTDYEHLHRCVHTWHSSIKHFSVSTVRVLFSLTLQMHFFPFLSWNEEIVILFWPNTQFTKLRRHCLLKAPFQVSSTHWGNQSNLGGRRTYLYCFCHLSARTVLFGWVWRYKKISWAMKEKPTLQCANE